MRIKYISWLSQQLGKDTESILLERNISLQDLFIQLADRFTGYHSEIFKNSGIVRASVDGKVVNDDFVITDDMEIILFAPMSGG